MIRSLPRHAAGRLKRAVRPAPASAPEAAPAPEDQPLEPVAKESLLPAVLHDITAPATLRDPVAQEAFNDLGYAVIDLISPAEVAGLIELAGEIYPGYSGRSWECDFFNDSIEVKRRVRDVFDALLQPALSRQLVDHQTVFQNFFVSWPGGDGLSLHEHSAVTDEAQFRSTTIWVAVSEVSLENGTLMVVPRSHRVHRRHKAEHTPEWFEDIRAQLIDDHLEAILIEPGQAIVFDNALLHSSGPNLTDGPRINAVIATAPREAALRYYRYDDDVDRLKIYELDPSFFIERVPETYGEWALPTGLTQVGEEPVDGRRLAAEDAAVLIPTGSGGRDARAVDTR